MTAATYGISDDELVQHVINFIPALVAQAQQTKRNEVVIYRFQNDEFDGRAWFDHPRHPCHLEADWLKDPAKRIHAHGLELVRQGLFTHVSFRYWRDHTESETGFYLVGYLPHKLGTR